MFITKFQTTKLQSLKYHSQLRYAIFWSLNHKNIKKRIQHNLDKRKVKKESLK